MVNLLDPFGLVRQMSGVALWTGEQLLRLLRSQVDALAPSQPAELPAAAPAQKQTATSLNAKMQTLLDRALDQSTRSSRTELFHHILDQLVADEARIIGALSDGSASPLVHVHAWVRPRVSGRAVLENASLIGRTANVALPNMVPMYIGHLLSLGLVEAGPEDPGMKTDYEVLMAEGIVLQAIKDGSLGPLGAKVEKYTLRLSTLGQSLWAATMQEDSR
jgi:hypothetical protein